MWIYQLRREDEKMAHTTSSVKVSVCNEMLKYPMLMAYLIGTPLRHIEKTCFKKLQNRHGSTQDIDNDLKYLIQSLDLCSNDFSFFLFTKTILLDQFHDIKMTSEVKLGSAKNIHQSRHLWCVKRDHMIDLSVLMLVMKSTID